MNFRRVFEERAFDVKGRVLALSDFHLMCDLPEGFCVYDPHRATLIKCAEELIGKSYPPLIATEYMLFRRTGDRGIYEGKFFMRRRDILTLSIAEYYENKGRFTDSIVNLLWAILEETTWVVPAHNPPKDGKAQCLPYAYTGEVDYIDLFSGSSAASLAVVYHLMRDKLDAVTPLLCERLLHELQRRIIRPFLDEENLARTMWWSGVSGKSVNNWNPWIISNVLTVCALTVQDMTTREAICTQAMRLLNAFTAVYHDDGGCDEGPSYWSAAGAALYDALCVLYDMTDGYVSLFDDELIRRMGEYKVSAFVTGQRFLNFADSPAKLSPTAALVYDWGLRVQSDSMLSYGAHFMNGELPFPSINDFTPYRTLRMLSLRPVEPAPFVAPTKVYLDGLQIAVTRQSPDPNVGLFLAFKGGHNAESHNHCDVGTVTVFSDGKPLFVDAGCGSYTSRTFSAHRYDIWSMRSDHHNVATVNNCVQIVGKHGCAQTISYDDATGGFTLDLTNAYPSETGLSSYLRSAVLQDGVICLQDDIRLEQAGRVDFHFMTTEAPQATGEGRFTIGGCMIDYDPTLRMSYEMCDHTEVETSGIAKAWDCEQLCRITLTAEGIREHTFTLTVHK